MLPTMPQINPLLLAALLQQQGQGQQGQAPLGPQLPAPPGRGNPSGPMGFMTPPAPPPTGGGPAGVGASPFQNPQTMIAGMKALQPLLGQTGGGPLTNFTPSQVGALPGAAGIPGTGLSAAQNATFINSAQQPSMGLLGWLHHMFGSSDG